jgi:hypothetical protein
VRTREEVVICEARFFGVRAGWEFVLFFARAMVYEVRFYVFFSSFFLCWMDGAGRRINYMLNVHEYM